ncbi:MAG: hypothetical protein HFJ09_13995 [Lachnospiraceae bacterium]|nr:hypothetical protein [Lachnospiraceae bacterium]
MENMIDILKRARDKKVFADNEFQELLINIQLADSNLKLDWDNGAGEEWARFSNQKDGIVCMVSAKIGVAFIRKNYKFSNIKSVMDMLEIVFTEDYCSENWFIDLANLKQMIPELYWHASEGAVNKNSFSLDDLYFATISEMFLI